MYESSLDIYIESVKYTDQFWLSNPDILIDELWNYFNDIEGFSFVSISYNQAKVYKTVGTEYEGTVLYIKGCSYQGKEFLTKSEIDDISCKIKDVLLLIDKLIFSSIIVKTNLFII